MKKRFSERRASYYIRIIVKAVDFCHKFCIIHRDIKPENIFLSYNVLICKLIVIKQNTPKLGDFGWSVTQVKNKRKTHAGTLDYLAPELVDEIPYDSSIDNWCIGVLTYELLVGHPPFESRTDKQTYERIRNLDYQFPSHVSKDAQDFISKLLVLDPSKRMPLSEVNNHPWIKKYMQSL